MTNHPTTPQELCDDPLFQDLMRATFTGYNLVEFWYDNATDEFYAKTDGKHNVTGCAQTTTQTSQRVYDYCVKARAKTPTFEAHRLGFGIFLHDGTDRFAETFTDGLSIWIGSMLECLKAKAGGMPLTDYLKSLDNES